MSPTLSPTSNVGVLISTVSDTAGVDETNAALDSTQASLDTLSGTAEATAGAVTGALDEMDASFVSLGASSADLEANLATIAGATTDAVGGITILGDATQGTADVVIASNDAMIASYREVGVAAGEAGAAQDVSAAGTDVAKGALGTAGLAGAITNPYVLAGAAIAGATAIIVKSAADFQQSITQLYTTAGETAPLKTLETGIENIATETGESTKQLTSGLYYISSAGYTAADGLDILTASAEAAKAENASLATVANAVTTAMVDYNVPADKATNITNELVTAVSRGKTTLQDLSSALSTVLPSANAAGISIGQVTGAVVTLTAGGKDAQNAAQDVNALIATLTKMTTQQIAAFQAMGLNAQDVSKNIGKEGLTGTLSEMFNAIEEHMGPDGLVIQSAMKNSTVATADMNTELKAMPPQLQSLATELVNGSISFADYRTQVQALPEGLTNLGKQFEATYNQTTSFNNALTSAVNDSPTFRAELQAMTGQSDALSAALLLTGGHTATFDNNVKAISASAKQGGSNIQEWSQVQGNFNTQLARAEQVVETLAIKIGTALLPYLTEAMKDFANTIGPIVNFISSNKQAQEALIDMVKAGFMPLIVTIQTTEIAFNVLRSAIEIGVGAFRDIKATVVDTYEVFDDFWHVIDDVITGSGNLDHALDTLGNQLKSWASQAIKDIANLFIGLPDDIAKAVGSTGVNLVKDIGHDLHIPGFAGGVTNFGGGMAMVGENGPELVMLPTGSSVLPNTQTNAALGSVMGSSSTTNNSHSVTIGQVVLSTAAAVSAWITQMDLDNLAVGKGLTASRGV